MTKTFKNLVLGKAGTKKYKNPLRIKKGHWASEEEEVPKKKKKPSEGNLYVDVSGWF